MLTRRRGGAESQGMSLSAPRLRVSPDSGTALAPHALYNYTMIFHVTMEQSDGWFAVECPALPGCVSQGRDEKKALENVKEAIEGWLWAEDQKAASKLPDADRIVVAI
jgi:predicted RNase H-like HicB family nuclease